MNITFKRQIAKLAPLVDRLVSMHPVRPDALPKEVPSKGIYLFSKNGRHLYVGRSNRIRDRIRRHCGNGLAYKGASFAFRLARRATRRQKASYKAEGSREDLMTIPSFRRAFVRAKGRIRAMELRYVAEPDQLRQALLEIYVAVALDTKHNDFDTH